MPKENTILVRCRNFSRHLNDAGEESSYFFMVFCGKDWYEYPPSDVIIALIDKFFEENPEDTILIVHGECHYCKREREETKGGSDEDVY